MFNSISWHGYWTVLAILTLAYYLLIYLFYFRTDFAIRFGSASKEDLHFETDEPDKNILYGCMDELNAFFQQSAKSLPVKQELLFNLQQIMSKYSALRDSSYKKSLTHVIRNGCEQYGSIHLSAEEVRFVWSEQ